MPTKYLECGGRLTLLQQHTVPIILYYYKDLLSSYLQF